MNDISDSILETTIDLLTNYLNIVGSDAILSKSKEFQPGITTKTLYQLKKAYVMRKEYNGFTTEQKIILIRKDLKKISEDLGKLVGPHDTV